MRIKNKGLFLFAFWVLSFTWALPTTILGALIALGLLVTGHKPKRYGPCICFPITEDWGLELGLFFICTKDEDEQLKQHEFGHHLQACFLLGPLTLFLATIPSIVRYWVRESSKRLAVVLVYYLIMIALMCGACCAVVAIGSITLYIIALFILIYSNCTLSWLSSLARNYNAFGLDDYDAFWVEADASERGKTIIERFWTDP